MTDMPRCAANLSPWWNWERERWVTRRCLQSAASGSEFCGNHDPVMVEQRKATARENRRRWAEYVQQRDRAIREFYSGTTASAELRERSRLARELPVVRALIGLEFRRIE